MKNAFLKMHGLGNDFVIIDGRDGRPLPGSTTIVRLSDRRRGIGCDQFIFLMPPEAPEADLFMRIYNLDGSEAEACGNATRCVTRLLFEETGKTKAIIQTIAGLLPVWREDENQFAVDFGEPRLAWQKIPLAEERDTLWVETGIIGLPPACCVNVGNPHAVFFIDNAEGTDPTIFGPKVETHPLFPAKTNVEFATILDRTTIRMRVWERGSGMTMACGSAASATFIAAVRRGLVERKGMVILDGGPLRFEWRQTDNHLILSGPTTRAFKGEWDDEVFE